MGRTLYFCALNSILFIIIFAFLWHPTLKRPIPTTQGHPKTFAGPTALNVTELSHERWVKEMEGKYRMMNERIRKMCRESVGDPPNQNPEQLNISIMKRFLTLLFSLKNKLGYCSQAKVATTTWLAHLSHLTEHPDDFKEMIEMDNARLMHIKIAEKFRLRGKDLKELWISLEDTKDAKTSVEEFKMRNNLLYFSFVRHPFERLVSCYKDKVEGSSKNKYSGQFEELKGFSFPKFVDHVIRSFHINNCAQDSFCNINTHWRPLNFECRHCDFHYDVIGKAETFAEDVGYIVYKLNLSHLISLNKMDQHLHKTQSKNSLAALPTERAIRYFKMLEKSKVKRLYNIYKEDFLLFDYDHQPYLKASKFG